MNNCLCIETDVPVNSSNRLSPDDCDFTCEDNTDVIYSGDCGGTSAYNLYEIQEGTSSINEHKDALSQQTLLIYVKKIIKKVVEKIFMLFFIYTLLFLYQ